MNVTSTLRTWTFFLWMWVVLFFSILLLIPLKILGVLGMKKARSRFIIKATKKWARHLVFTSGSKIQLSGQENIPEKPGYCVVANHQSNFDIPLIMAILPDNVGFIAKYEMMKVPLLNTWMRALNCVFIKRNNIRHAIQGIKEALNQVQDGKSMVLFPEGTRSRDGRPGKFHHAGMRLALERGIPVLPITIKNSFGMFERNKKIIPVQVEIVIHRVHSGIDPDINTAVSDLGDTIINLIPEGDSVQ